MHLTVADILIATAGELLQGSPAAVVRAVSIDSRAIPPGGLFVPLPGTRHDGHDFIAAALRAGAAGSLVRHGHPCAEQLCSIPGAVLISVADPLQALGDIARRWRATARARIIAITGSNGKTTTKEMLWSILHRHMNILKNPGNWNNLIGLPLTVLQLSGDHDAAILEMGMSELGEIRRLTQISDPHIGCVTTIGPAHLEQLRTIEGVQAAKAELVTSLGSDRIAVLNSDDPRVAALSGMTIARTVFFGENGSVQAGQVSASGPGQTSFSLTIEGSSVPVTLSVPGSHHVQNALAAAAVAHCLDIPLEEIAAGLTTFRGIPGRMQLLSTGGLTIINDAYNANPVSMQASLHTLAELPGKKKIAVLGDMLELGADAPRFHHEAGVVAGRLGIDLVFVIGDFARHIQDGARAAGIAPARMLRCADIDELATAVADNAEPGDVILLKGSRKVGLDRLVALLQQDDGGNGRLGSA